MTEIVSGHSLGAGMAQELQPQDPRKVGPYRLLARLGGGGMGQVYLGWSPGGRLVAVKVVRAELAEQAEFRSRFAREVAAARAVSGLFTAAVVDADVDAAMPWLATAYVPGPSLAEAITTHGPLPAASVLALAAGLAEGLGAIHAAGIVHRDLKPSNVLLAEDGPRVIDFGISRAAEAAALTSTGQVFGSPAFMSPEQALGRQVGPPSDVFSLGAVLAFAATGQGPFGSGSGPTLMYRVVFTPPDVGGLPAGLRPLVEWCLAKDPDQRPTTKQFLAELNIAPPEAGWLPGPIIQALPLHLPSVPCPTEPTAVDNWSVPPVSQPPAAARAGAPGGKTLPGPSYLGLTRAVAAVALIIAYLVMALAAHLPPFARESFAPSSPAPATTAPASTGAPPSSAGTSPAVSPATTPAVSPATTPAASPATTPAASPETTPATSPETTPATSPETTPATTPETTPATSPETTPATSPATHPATTPATSPATTPAATPETTPAGSSRLGSE